MTLSRSVSRADSTMMGVLARLPDGADHVQTVHVGQAQIEHHQVRVDPRVGVQRLLARRRGLDTEVVARQVRLNRAHDARLVVDHQHTRARRLAHATFAGRDPGVSSGSVNVKRAPPPARFSAHTRPPCASTRPFHDGQSEPQPLGQRLDRR